MTKIKFEAEVTTLRDPFGHLILVADLPPCVPGHYSISMKLLTEEPRDTPPLLPCPHCGALPCVWRASKKTRARVQCVNCLSVVYGNTESEAIAAWNRRDESLYLTEAFLTRITKAFWFEHEDDTHIQDLLVSKRALASQAKLSYDEAQDLQKINNAIEAAIYQFISSLVYR